MGIATRLVVLGLLIAFVRSAIVTPFTCSTGTCEIYDVLWPSSTNYVIQMTDGWVYASSDEGQTWTPTTIATYMGNFDADPMSIIFILQRTGQIYRSTDGGKTTTACNKPPIVAGSIVSMSLHPNKIGTFLVVSCTTSCQVYYTQDFGNTWNAGPAQLARYYVAWSSDPNSPNTMFFVKSDATFGYTTDFGAHWTAVVNNTIGFVFTDHYLYVGQAIGYNRARLYSSSNRLDASHLNRDYYWVDEFPTGDTIPEYGYTFLDDTARSEFIALKQTGNTQWGSVFSSDFDGDIFALSLNYVAEEDMYYDFDKFNGLAGIYIANAFPTATSNQKQTKFTFDNGGDWNLIAAPVKNFNGAPTNCNINNGCSLHLHGILSWYNNSHAPYYTSPNAIGLMIAVGNLGTSLSYDPTLAKTYFTRDAGITWAEIFDQPTIYEFGDHGGILVFATTNGPTNRVYYSTNEGKDFNTFQFNDTAIYVDNIFIEPSGTGRKFVLYGHDSKNKNYFYGLDFTDLNLPTCADSDYELWSPSNDDYANTTCFMGAVTVYQRRKQDSKCYNDRDTDHEISSDPCPCDWEDYECDIGYAPSGRNISDGFTCSSSSASTPSCATGYRLIPDTHCVAGLDLTAKNCPGYSGSPTTSVSTGIYPTTGSVTTGPITTTGQPAATTATTTTTGGKKSGGNGGTVFVIILFVLIFGSVTVVGVLYWKHDGFREFVQDKLFKKDHGYGRVNTNVEDDAGDDLVA